MSAPRRNVAYTKPEAPSFLKAFKAKVGYKEPVSIDAKRAPPPSAAVQAGEAEKGEEEREDELPAVVVLRQGDISMEEYQTLKETSKETESQRDNEDSPTKSPGAGQPDTRVEGSDGKIVFKKPEKRKNSEGGGGALDASTKKPRQDGSKPSHRTSPRSKVRAKAVKNASLLSFGEEEEES